MDDLEAVEPVWEEPLRADYRGLTVTGLVEATPVLPKALRMQRALVELARRERATGLARWWWERPAWQRRGLIGVGVAVLFALLVLRSA